MTTTADAPSDGFPGAPARAGARSRATGRHISQIPYLPGLDGLRAIAVVAVMVYHANSDWLAGGYLGVEVFFVISGYLITLLLIAEHERSGSIDLKNFWIRRFRRLLPALFVMMLLITMYVAVFKRRELGLLRGDVIAGVAYGSNWYQIFIGAGYSAGNDFAPLRHLWSLAVEEQFYVIWPLVMLGFVRFGSRGIASIARWLFLLAVAITVVVALLSHSGAQQGPEFTPEAYWFIGDRPISKPDALYLSTITRSSGLLLGAAFAMIWRPTAIMRGPLRHKGALFDLAAIGGFAALAAMAWFVGFQPSQGVHGFLFRGGLFATGIASLALIAAVTHQGAFTGRVLSMPFLLWIGTRSYGLYLYHWPIYQIIRGIAAKKLELYEFVLAMVLTCIVTELSYRFIETPIRQGRLGEVIRGRRNGRRTRVLTTGQRRGVVGAIVGTTMLSIFAVGSLATAELEQNDVQQSLDDNAEFRCDTLVDLDCDGTPDLDADGQPLVVDESGIDFEPAASVAGEPIADSGAGSEAGNGTDPAGAADADDAPIVPGTTVPEPVEEVFVPIELLAVGDSVMAGTARELVELGFTVDAFQNRSWANGLSYVQGLAAQGRLPETMVIHLGHNSGIPQGEMDAMMAAVADVDNVWLLTIVLPEFPDLAAQRNQIIVQTQAAYDNVNYIDWGGGLADGCPKWAESNGLDTDCFASDDIHMKSSGAKYYARLLTDFLEL